MIGLLSWKPVAPASRSSAPVEQIIAALRLKRPFMSPRALSIFVFLLAFVGEISAQTPSQTSAGSRGPLGSPEIVEILGISVEGTSDEYTNSFIQQTSRLTIGQKLTLPGDPVLGEAIRSIFRLSTYEDVQIVQERRVGTGVYLVIKVREVPKLKAYEFTGIKKGHAKDLQKEVPLVTRGPMHESSIDRSVQIIKEFL